MDLQISNIIIIIIIIINLRFFYLKKNVEENGNGRLS